MLSFKIQLCLSCLLIVAVALPLPFKEEDDLVDVEMLSGADLMDAEMKLNNVLKYVARTKQRNLTISTIHCVSRLTSCQNGTLYRYTVDLEDWNENIIKTCKVVTRYLNDGGIKIGVIDYNADGMSILANKLLRAI